MLKNFFLSEKKLLNVILRAKLKYMKKTDFHEFELFAEKVILELKCT